MVSAPPSKLQQRRVWTIMFTFPILVVTTAVLYRRLYLGEEQRKLPSHGKILPPPARFPAQESDDPKPNDRN